MCLERFMPELVRMDVAAPPRAALCAQFNALLHCVCLPRLRYYTDAFPLPVLPLPREPLPRFTTPARLPVPRPLWVGFRTRTRVYLPATLPSYR